MDRIEKSFLHLCLQGESCAVDEHAAYLLMLREKDIDDALANVDLVPVSLYAGLRMDEHVPGQSDGLFVIARKTG